MNKPSLGYMKSSFIDPFGLNSVSDSNITEFKEYRPDISWLDRQMIMALPIEDYQKLKDN